MLNQKNLIIVVVSFAAIHIAVTFSAHSMFHNYAWEYKSLDMPVKITGELSVDFIIKAEQRLKELGQDGWEAYAVVEDKNSIDNTGQVVYLKRPL